MKYGPNTQEVKSLLCKVENLTREQSLALATTWGAKWSDHATWEKNLLRTKDAARNASRLEAWETGWTDAWSVWSYYCPAPEAWQAFNDAVMALLVKDLIAEDVFNDLYGPWASVMEVENE